MDVHLKPILIGNRPVGGNSPCLIIAEVGVNHNANLALAHKHIDSAADAGADVVKFQTWKTEELMVRNAPMPKYQQSSKEDSEFKLIKGLELEYSAFIQLKKHAEERGLIFLSTPDVESAADFLAGINVDAFKIGSGELNNIPYLEYVARKGLPMIVSTGAGTLKEAAQAARAIRKAGNNRLVMLHCTSSYPARVEDCNLNVIKAMRTRLRVLVGYSDHTTSLAIPVAAVALGAVVIEKHLTLDKSLPGPDQKASFDPAEFGQMVRMIRAAEAGMGNGIKQPTPAEKALLPLIRKSIVAKSRIEKGTKLIRQMIALKRPGTGTSPSKLAAVLGKRTTKDLQPDEQILLSRLR